MLSLSRRHRETVSSRHTRHHPRLLPSCRSVSFSPATIDVSSFHFQRSRRLAVTRPECRCHLLGASLSLARSPTITRLERGSLQGCGVEVGLLLSIPRSEIDNEGQLLFVFDFGF